MAEGNGRLKKRELKEIEKGISTSSSSGV